MTTVLLVGAGVVGRRAARQLVESDGVTRLLIADRLPEHREVVCRAVGAITEPLEWNVGEALPAGVDVVACALPSHFDRAVAERALEAGVPCASAAGDLAGVRRLLDLDDVATEAGVTVAAGCALAPGLTDVLARHAADALDALDEVHVARFGIAGATCVAAERAAGSGECVEWHDGGWSHARAGTGRQLVWFPDPVGPLECARIVSGQVSLLVDAFPGLERATARASRRERIGPRVAGWRRGGDEGGYGAACVEVRGRRGASREVAVYGVVDRMAIVAGTVLALATVAIVGGLGGRQVRTGAHGLGAIVEPVPFLAELARRGVKVAAFEGSAAA